jgi:hypothetical protein
MEAKRMGVPSREARLAHAAKHCELWNAGKKEDFVASWRTIAQGDVTMYDPVGTKAKHGFDHATGEAFDMFQAINKMYMLTVKVNGNEMAWVIENHFGTGDDISKTYSIETYAWDDDGNLTIKTYYEVPSSLGEDDDPYEYLIGKENVIPND